MAELNTKIKLYANSLGVNEIDFRKDVILRDKADGNGAYISEWNLDIAQPTNEQLLSFEDNANTQETNNNIIETRKFLYGTWESQLEEINEQGIDAWKSRIAQIKSDNPKE